ncbi:ABC multidrug transporter MDR5 [Cladobotryum mycophilum]|uniref:ABC multidrug transporter MDR5 n=1 Tax=Cladobotryum mycophilum TaxID=491253 RepID=A0ABR0SUU3_9HYPO
MEDLVAARFGGLLAEHSVRARKYALKAMIWFALSEAIDLLAMALAFWYGGTLLVNGGYTTEQFFIVFIAIVFGSQSAGSYFAHSSDISKGASAINKIMSMEKSSKTRLPSQEEGKWDLQSKLASNAPVFELRNVDFCYPARPDRRVLQDVTISMNPGQFIAIVGESGSGKSTITGILERFYHVHGGEVYLYGSKLESIPDDGIHDALAMNSGLTMIATENQFYTKASTIKDNLLVGTTRDVLQEELDHVIATCQLTDLIQSLPEGYFTTVGSRGAALSGGQRQRIAIARALIRNASVLLLDEATSALDSMSEKLIHEALMRWRQLHGGMLVIAHRLSTVRAADIIYVMDQGRVVEGGSHAELLAQQGRYYNMWRSVANGEDGQH